VDPVDAETAVVVDAAASDSGYVVLVLVR